MRSGMTRELGVARHDDVIDHERAARCDWCVDAAGRVTWPLHVHYSRTADISASVDNDVISGLKMTGEDRLSLRVWSIIVSASVDEMTCQTDTGVLSFYTKFTVMLVSACSYLLFLLLLFYCSRPNKYNKSKCTKIVQLYINCNVLQLLNK